MNQLSTAQWDTMQAAHQGRFRQHLVLAIETRFGRPEGGSDLRSPEQVVDAALAFAEAVGATTDAQVARIAALLATVNRQRLTHDQVSELRAVLTQAGKTADERIADAAGFLGIEA
jgi:hypothetical protein